MEPIHELQVPDDLIAWGKDANRARTWMAPWAHEVEQLMKRRTLSSHQTGKLLSRLTALCVEAIRAGRDDLLLGIDLFTASWLGLEVDVEMKSGETVTFGKDYSYGELHALVEAGPDCIPAARRAKSVLQEVFPRARISAMIDTRKSPPPACLGCGQSDAVMLDLEHGSKYCSPCWRDLTKRFVDKPKKSKAKRK